MIENQIKEQIRNFVIIAHIDAGKSTLADRFLELTGTVEKRQMKNQLLDQMDLERERGITIKLQPVRMNYTLNSIPYTLNLIDTPGHVDFSYEVSRSLAAVEGAILLVDATQGVQAQTLANLYHALEQNLTIIPVINKIDLANADIDKSKKEIMELIGFKEEEILTVSAKTGQNVTKVLDEIIKKVPAPSGDVHKPTQALVFDSLYDSYRGVIAYVRVVNGKISKNDPIKLLATKAQDLALEVGTFSPKLTAKDCLQAGEIGYIVTGLKDVTQCQVGDTLTTQIITDKKTDRNGSNIRSSQGFNLLISVPALPGYKKVMPMVFANIYSANGEINKLRDALGKLKLNDASLFFEPDNSLAFGFGFRCGFLGLLHLEIIKERLEREYDLSLIVTTPKVNYKEYSTLGKTQYEEPWCKVEVITPQDYLGAIMDLFDRNRGIYQEMKYLGERVILIYQCPLMQVIVNFYDQLKSISAGYASMNYQFTQYKKEDLVRMDILVAGEKVDVLSQIVHRLEIFNRGQQMVKKLQELIPRQMFEVSLQAAMGSKVIARENIPAMKKDVTGYLYGGDVSRKKKLWAKQARGKKRMKKLGRVDIPTDVFINLLKN